MNDGPLMVQDGIRCEHCGHIVIFNLPLPVEVVTKLIRAFVKLHELCEKDRPVFKAVQP